jgi:hypothetical protein
MLSNVTYLLALKAILVDLQITVACVRKMRASEVCTFVVQLELSQIPSVLLRVFCECREQKQKEPRC